MKVNSYTFAQNRLNLLFAIILILFTIYFFLWGLSYTQHNLPLIFLLSGFFGLFMAFNIGGNDVANSFGTSVGSGTLTVTQALLIAAVFEIGGALIAGGNVTSTIRSGIVDIKSLGVVPPKQFIFIMMSALIAASLWLLFATRRGLPVSTTHSIIGGIVGSAIVFSLRSDKANFIHVVRWDKLGDIALSWVISPLLGGMVSAFLFFLVKKYVLTQKGVNLCATQGLKAQNYRYTLRLILPAIASLSTIILTSMLLLKGLRNLKLGLEVWQNSLIILIVAALAWMFMKLYSKKLETMPMDKALFSAFSWMQVFTASAFAFSHGSNDIANAVGPFIAILDTLHGMKVQAQAHIPLPVILTFGVSMIVGLWFIGKRVIATVGTHLTEMHPSSGFIAELSAAVVVMFASALGLPVSSTHILVGAVLGIGFVNRNANWRLMRPITLAWVITVPCACVLSILAYLILQMF